jgi:hypothetical protein
MIPRPAVDAFRAIVGEEWCLDTPENLATYSYDAFLPEFKPDVVILPGSTGEIAKVMKVASTSPGKRTWGEESERRPSGESPRRCSRKIKRKSSTLSGV